MIAQIRYRAASSANDDLDFANANIIAKPAFFAAFINLLWRWWRRAGYACFQPNEKRIKRNAKNGENNQLAKHWHHPQFDLLADFMPRIGRPCLPAFYFIAWAGGNPYHDIEAATIRR